MLQPVWLERNTLPGEDHVEYVNGVTGSARQQTKSNFILLVAKNVEQLALSKRNAMI